MLINQDVFAQQLKVTNLSPIVKHDTDL